MWDIKEVLSKVKELPPFPQVALRVLRLLAQEAPFREIAPLIELDEGFTAEVLRVCNSPFFGLRRQVSSVKEALVYLGEKYLLEIISRVASRNYLFGEHSGYDLRRGELWGHAVACALASDLLEERRKGQRDPTLFTAALLHDIGKVILSSYVAQAFEEILKRVKEGKGFVEAEREAIGIDHASLGGEIARSWNFPEEIVDAILYHHEPEKSKTPYAYKVHIANAMCSLMGVGTGVDELRERVRPEAYGILGLDRRELMLLLSELCLRFEKAKELFGLE